MNEEEKKAIKFMRQWHNYAEIKTLLDLIEKQNKKIEQLEKENEEYRKDYVEYKKQEPQQLSIKKLAEEILNLKANSIPKSVIREKIEELRYKRDKTEITYYLDAQIDILKELLGEEK